VPARLGLESEPSSRTEKAPIGGTHPSAREGKGRKGWRAVGQAKLGRAWGEKEWSEQAVRGAGLGKERARPREGEKKGLVGLGRKEEKESKKKKGKWAGPN
jgi:hypothetical protein